jgi:hypothetical protein
MRKGIAFFVMLAAVALASPATAQAPKVTNAAFEQRAVTGGLQPFFESLARGNIKLAWVGYSVPAAGGRHLGCCGDSSSYSSNGCGPCYLEGRPTAGTVETPVKLEGDSTILVLFRIENQRVGRLSVFSSECQLDAGGLSFIWLTGVSTAESVRLISALARDAALSDRVVRAVPMAIALHADPAADAALEQLMAPQQPLESRKQAAFWLGVARGEHGYQILKTAAEQDASADFRRQAAFALSQSQAAGALDTLIAMAKTDADAGVRGQALFWLAQKAGKKAIGTLTDAIANDPESQVRERAVFALSQLPKDEGVPLLIQVARTNRDPHVRQRAMFWLGQSKDARALAFFEEVLKGRA